MSRDLPPKFTSRARLLTIILLMIVPALLCLFYIRAYGVNVSFWDQWALVPLFDEFKAGDLSLSDLYAQHNEHRIFFPRLTMLLLGLMTQWNTVAEMYLSWFLLCLVGYVLFRAYTRTFGGTVPTLAKFVLVIWLVFSLRQSENLLWGFQIAFFMLVLFFVLAIYLLETSRGLGWRFALSAISGVVCSFSSANGLLVWPIGLLMIFLARRLHMEEPGRSYLKMASVWCLIGVFVYVAYYADYTHPAHHPSLGYFIGHPLNSLRYFLVGLGSPLSFDEYSAVGIGALLLALYIYVLYIYIGGYALRRRPAPQYPMPIAVSLILFALLTAALLTVSRSGFGVEQALSSKYTTFTTLGIVGLYMYMLSLKVRYESVKPFLVGSLLCLVFLGITVSYGHAIDDGRWMRADRDTHVYYLSTFRLQSDENLARLYPDPQVVRERAEVLEKYDLNVFAEPRLELGQIPLAEGSTLFSVDIINGRWLSQADSPMVIDAQNEETIVVAGWAVDENAGRAADGVFINVDGQIDIPSLYGLDRPDVADCYDNSRYKHSGFFASFATSVLGEGRHVLSLRVVTADKTEYYEPDQEFVVEVR